MEKAEEFGKKEQFSSKMNVFSRDLLTKMVKNSHAENEKNNEDEEIELSLGLSLNGKFGVDPKMAAEKQRAGVFRSSSLANFMVFGDDGKQANARVLPVVGHAPPLMRTCSLPVESQEEWRKRKEMQSLRRKEVKRKRMERKINIVGAVTEKVKEDNGDDDNGDGDGDGVYGNGGVSNGDEEGLVSVNVINENSNSNENSHSNENCCKGLVSSQGSQGSGSSGISDFESVQGVSKNAEMRIPNATQLLPEQNKQSAVVGVAEEKRNDDAKELFRKTLLEMPCVSTRGDGPNGRKINGFLYKFQKGEEVRIVCVCHGSFLTPAEFVKHGGGGDVTHPLRHIVINPSPIL